MRLYPTATEKYIRESGRLTTESSRSSARAILGPLQRAWPEQHVADFTARQLTEFCLHGTPAPNTIKARRARIRSAWDWFQFDGLIKTNPSSDLKYTLNPSSNTVRDGTWLTAHQIRLVLQSCDDTLKGRRDELVVLFGMLCGLRRFEIARLRWTDFNPDLSSFKILGKGDKRASVGVPPQLQAKLVEWRELAPADAVAVIPAFRQSFTVVNDAGVQDNVEEVEWHHPLGIHGVHYVLEQVSARVPFKFRCHDLRRTYAGILEEKGLDLKQIQELMRHNNINTTDRYLARNPNKTVKLAQMLEIDL